MYSCLKNAKNILEVVGLGKEQQWKIQGFAATFMIISLYVCALAEVLLFIKFFALLDVEIISSIQKSCKKCHQLFMNRPIYFINYLFLPPLSLPSLPFSLSIYIDDIKLFFEPFESKWLCQPLFTPIYLHVYFKNMNFLRQPPFTPMYLNVYFKNMNFLLHNHSYNCKLRHFSCDCIYLGIVSPLR